MFNPEEYNRRAKRFQQKDRHVKKQCKILKQSCSKHWMLNEPHRFAKIKSMNCGNPNCIFCMNPRKSFNTLTIQEQRFHTGADRDGLE